MANLVTWTQDISVGIQEIDEQHKVLINLLNSINEAVEQRRSLEVAKEILGKLIDYSRIHFSVEESLMRVLNYPGYDEHKELHQDLMDNIIALSQKLDEGKLAVGVELQYFLKNWLVKHIMETDKQYTEHFIKAGAQTTFKKSSWNISFW
ncbi:hemerythrin [Achromatium sp. WMS2]|nr:hemerythrin [Achromatium sp. WMS2]